MTTPDAGLRAALTHAISVLENYGDHHEWCARADGSAEPCSCGLWDELERLRAALAPAPAGLDVERLAAAITRAIPVGYPIRDYVRAAADGIAREYARAATRPAEDAG